MHQARDGAENFWDALKLEAPAGSRRSLLNYSGPCGCARLPCFKGSARQAWGEGVQSRALSPYRSIAVDRTRSVRSWMYIRARRRDDAGDAPWGGWCRRCVQAADTGSAIVGKHIDFFVGLKSSYTSLINTEGLASVTVRHGGTLCTGEQPDDDEDEPQDDDEPDVTTQVCFPGADNQNTTCLPLAFPVNPTGYKYPAPLNANYRSPIAYLDLDAVDVNTKVAPNFTLGEFVSRAKGRYAVLQPHAVVRMQTLRGQSDRSASNSGYRSRRTNASVGGGEQLATHVRTASTSSATNVTLTKAEKRARTQRRVPRRVLRARAL